MESRDISACLALLALPRVGSTGVARLLRAAPSPEAALQLDEVSLAVLGLRPETIAALRALDGRPDVRSRRGCEWVLAHRVEVLTIRDSRYPARLAGIATPPPVLFVRGRVAALAEPQVAMVGSRRPTPGGRETAFGIAAALVHYGLHVISGLAIGIDTAAHQGALAGGGHTLAVLGTGPDRTYPQRNTRLAEQIVAEGGALLSEFLPGTGPEAGNFPRRNRIVAGLSLGVLVVEAALPSGSLLTAQHAADQGREVMAVPGPVRSLTSRGCHELIRNGAALVEQAEDVIRALGDRFAAPQPPVSPATVAAVEPGLGALERTVLESTDYTATDVDTIIARSGQPAAMVGATLVMLELRGLVASGPGGYARL